MTMNSDDLELRERLDLIESMIGEGRRTTENWGWVFVLWGVAYYVAIAWSAWRPGAWAWPVTMVTASVVTWLLVPHMRGQGPATTIGRALGSIWMGTGASLFVLFMALGFTHRLTDMHLFVAVLGAMLGAANAASSMILKWKMQFACAVVWWGATLAACFGTVNQASMAFLVAIFFCQIVFGVYGTVSASRRQRLGASHA